MLKIAIITIHGIPNFGSALQAFALQHYINSFIPNAKADIIDYDYRHIVHRIKRIQVSGFVNFIYSETFGRFKKLSPQRKEKLNKFQLFRDNEMKLTRRYLSPFTLRISNELKCYNVFLTGSDQVWNTKEIHGDTIFLLDFVSGSKLKYSFGASFGISNIEEKYKKDFAEYLQKYENIGVREMRAKEIINDLGVTVPVQVTCDPTLLIDRNDYQSLLKNSNLDLTEPFILVYGLDYAFNPMPAIRKVIDVCVNEMKCKVVFLSNNTFGYDGEFLSLSNAGPYDFLYLFANARYVITSSFHGTVFSLINRVPFTPISPEKGDTRILDLLSVVGLEHLIIHPMSNDIIVNTEELYTDEVIQKMDIYIQNSKDYLSKILK